MTWLLELHKTQTIAYAVIVFASVAVLGLTLGSFKYKGISIGIAGVLFSGIALGHLGFKVEKEILEFVREFGLILFVFTVGMQVGPGFFASLRKQGLPLNLMAAGVVVTGAMIALLLSYLLNIDIAAIVGVFSGAVTNTPALGAATGALKSLPGIAPERLDLPAMGYAVAYPFGVIGIILSMIIIRSLFRVNVEKEATEFRQAQKANHQSLERMTVMVDNDNLNGLRLDQLPGRNELPVVVTRVKQAGNSDVMAALSDTVLHKGDLLLAVGTRKNLDQFRLIIGVESNVDLTKHAGNVISRRLIVTHKEVLGKTIEELGLDKLHGVIVSRVTRADIEMTAIPDIELQFGDMLQAVGEPEDMENAAKLVGNSIKELNHTNLIPIFLGIALGLAIGTYPISLGTMPAPVKLGLAGGPLLAALILSRIGRIGPLVWYMPVNANLALREFGIVLFLACVGLKAGESFFATVLKGDGLLWVGCGAAITVLPILIFGILARWLWKQNFMNVCGLLAGRMTDPPALQFANTISNSDSPSVAYATVYPLTMLLRILLAQLMVLLFCR
jgi:putative transport protein